LGLYRALINYNK